MATFTLSRLLSTWFSAADKRPARTGWYRVKARPLPAGAAPRMAYYDGSGWTGFVQLPWNKGANTRVSLDIVQWQGLSAPAADCARQLRQHHPLARGPENQWLTCAELLEQFLVPA